MSENTIREKIGALPFTSVLTESQAEYAQENASIRKYAKGEIVHGGGRTCLGMVFVLKGSLRVYLQAGRSLSTESDRENCVFFQRPAS